MRQTITYQGHHIAYYLHGSGEPLLFLHGWPTNAQLWAAQVEALKANYRVITLDWLGFGASDKPLDHHYTFTRKREILDLLLQEVLTEGEQITLIAHDIGGPPAVLWASENEARVRRLILLNTVLYPLATPLDRASHLFFNTPIINTILMSSFGLRTIMKTNTRSGSTTVNQRISAILAAFAETEKAVKLKTILEPMNEGRRNELLTLSEQLSNLQVEKHLVIAREDPLCFAHVHKFYQENPEVPAHFMDNCGHYIPIDRPAELNDILNNILTP